jgi:hypothetical protein
MRRKPCCLCQLLPAAVLLLLPGLPAGADSQAVSSPAGAIRGDVTTLGGTVLLPGATVRLEAAGSEAGTGGAGPSTVSDDHGRFTLTGLQPGRYRLTVSLAGFRDLQRELALGPGRALDLALDLELAGVSETVVVPPVGVEGGMSLGSAGMVDLAQLQTAPADEVGVESAQLLIPGVVRGPAGVSIKGGRPNQSTLLLGDADLADPATGETDIRIPGDAIGSLEVLPSPYAVEYGRFSSGITTIQARRGGDSWQVSLASINPAFRTKRDHPLTVIGIEKFGPRLSLRGPLVKDRVWLAESVQYRFASQDIPSRPQDERRRSESVSSLTRLDATLATGHTLVATLGAFLEKRGGETLGTFDPPEVTASRRQNVYDLAVSEESSVGHATALDSTLHLKVYDVHVYGQGTLPMEIAPSGQGGNYFNDQTRKTWALQWRESFSGVQQGLVGTHFYKAGVDLVRGSFSGTSVSHPVDVRRADGTLAQQTLFESNGETAASATDLTLFLQDRWQPVAPLIVEAGVRGDRFGVAREWTVSPRLGARLRLGPAGKVTLAAGIGRFVEPIPLAVGSLDSVEPRTVTSFAPDGETALGSVRYVPRVGPSGLAAPRALTWHVESDVKLTEAFSVHAHALARDGSREHVLVQEAEGDSGWLTLDSRGHSRYREVSFGARYTRGAGLTAQLSYVRSIARADTNPAASFLGSIREPLVRTDSFARADSDVPNRLLVQLRGETGKWRWASVFEWRDGLPYSAVDELQQYVGTPNEAGRLPAVAQLDLSLERRLKLWKLRAWIGLQLLNVLGRFNAQDVQTNVDAPDFGSFYNSDPFRLRLTIRL